jgi:hypothetical protein
MTRQTRTLAVLALIGVVVAIGVVTAVRMTQPDVCDGVARDLGGCEDTYNFSATECRGVGKEFGAQVNDEVKAVLTGPEVVDSETRGVRITHTWTVAATRANQWLKAEKVPCDGASFMDAASEQIGPEVKAGVGSALFLGTQGSYEGWIAEVRSVTMGIIDASPSS